MDIDLIVATLLEVKVAGSFAGNSLGTAGKSIT